MIVVMAVYWPIFPISNLWADKILRNLIDKSNITIQSFFTNISCMLMTLPTKVGPVIVLEYEMQIPLFTGIFRIYPSFTHTLPFTWLFASKIRPWIHIIRHSCVMWRLFLPRTLRCFIYCMKFAFPVQNMGVIIAEQCMVGGVACVQDRCAEFTSDFGLGALKRKEYRR